MKSGSREKIMKGVRGSWSDKVFLAIVYTTIIAVTLACLYPLYFTVIASFSDPNMVYTGQVNFLAKGFTLDSYKNVFQDKRIWSGYANSIFYTMFGTLYALCLTIPAAYALSKKHMFGRKFFTWMFMLTMYFSGGLVPTYILVNKMGLVDTRLILIVSGGLSVYNIIVTRTFFQNNIPETLYEAARIDGANEFYIFFRIVISLSAPIIAVMALYYAVGHWSGYFTAMIYITDEDLQPLQIILRRILILNEKMYEETMASNASSETIMDAARKSQQALTMKFALVFVGSAPMLIAYPFVQKHFVKGMMIGSVKE